MSRIGKKPIDVPGDVKVAISGAKVSVEGPKGKLERDCRPEITVKFDEDKKQVVVSANSEGRIARAMHGLTRALIQNMVTGVKDGFEKKLEIVGVGYLAAIQGKELQMRVGFANEIRKNIPDGLNVTCPDQNHIVVQGCDKQMVGQFAAEVRSARPPEPYKGKGVRYDGEQVKIKPGKAAT